MTSVLVTGASGFIGSALTKKLRGDGLHVVALGSSDGDISSPLTLQRTDLTDISHVFHLAGRTYVPDSWDHPYEFYKTNTLGTEVVLEFCRKNSISLTYISAYIYGIPKCLPISEDAPVEPSNPYAHSKYLGEELCRFYTSIYGLNISIIRPFNVFGVGQAESFLIPSIIRQVLYQNEIVVNDLAPKRDYVYISDLINCITSTQSLLQGYHVFNAGSGFSYSVEEVIELVQKCAETDKPVKSKGDVRPNEIPDVKADTSQARKVLHWQCQMSFEKGILEMVRWERSK